MELEKAEITTEGGDSIQVLFNPTKYSLDQSNQLAEVGVPGLSAPIVQYVRGNNRSLSMELYFDTYEQQTDVREHTDKIYGLLGIEGETHVPPICTFTWGSFSFTCVLAQANGRFTLFLADGTPVRATLDVTFKEYVDVEVLVREVPTESSDLTKTHWVKRGDTLSDIAAREYGDATQWRAIAEANQIDNPRLVSPGQALVIPPLT
jgi:LysM repeat protein